MSMTFDVPDSLADLLRTLATERGMSIEAMGEQALTVGLTTLAGVVSGDTIDIGSTLATQKIFNTTISMHSPITVSREVPRRQITIDQISEASTDAD